jgi:hypothetical protein
MPPKLFDANHNRLTEETLLSPYFMRHASIEDRDHMFFLAVKDAYRSIGRVQDVKTWDDWRDRWGRKMMGVDVRLKTKSITIVAETPDGETVMIHSDNVSDAKMLHLALAPMPGYRFGSHDQMVYDRKGGEYRIEARLESFTMTQTIGATYTQDGPTGLFLPSSTFILPPKARGITMVELE